VDEERDFQQKTLKSLRKYIIQNGIYIDARVRLRFRIQFWHLNSSTTLTTDHKGISGFFSYILSKLSTDPTKIGHI
jgi:hypothetical protein